jgi:hypothetical protein
VCVSPYHIAYSALFVVGIFVSESHRAVWTHVLYKPQLRAFWRDVVDTLQQIETECLLNRLCSLAEREANIDDQAPFSDTMDQ